MRQNVNATKRITTKRIRDKTYNATKRIRIRFVALYILTRIRFVVICFVVIRFVVIRFVVIRFVVAPGARAPLCPYAAHAPAVGYFRQ